MPFLHCVKARRIRKNSTALRNLQKSKRPQIIILPPVLQIGNRAKHSCTGFVYFMQCLSASCDTYCELETNAWKTLPSVEVCSRAHRKMLPLKLCMRGEKTLCGVLFRWNTKHHISLLSSVAERHTMCEDVKQAKLYCYYRY